MPDFEWKTSKRHAAVGNILVANIQDRQIKIGQNMDKTYWWSEDYVIAFNGYTDVKKAQNDAAMWVETGRQPNVVETLLVGLKD